MIARRVKGARTGLVMLHGRGGSGADILSLLDHAALPDVAAVAPQAAGNSWWPTSFLAPEAALAPFLAKGLSQVADAVQALQADGIPASGIWLCGFSQGACLALEAYARQGSDLAGVFAFSGGLLGQKDMGQPSEALYGYADKSFDYSAQIGGRVWISVHQRDPHIPLKRVEDSAAAFRSLGAQVDQKVYPGSGHSVMQDDIMAMRKHLNG